jgi:hypothetical protein
MFQLIAIDFSQKSSHFSLLSTTSPCELSGREVTSPSNLKIVGALDNYSLVFVIFIKQLTNFLKRAETSIVLMVYNLSQASTLTYFSTVQVVSEKKHFETFFP